MLVIGLTGGIGSGKSTVVTLFEALGVEVFDADVIARELLQPGRDAFAPVLAVFGDGILDVDGRIDRGRLAELVFSDPGRRRALESIVHPLVRHWLKEQLISARGPYCILCVPLLVETNMDDMVDRVLVIDIDPDTQLKRLLANRPLDEAGARRIIAAQASRQERLARADDIIDNNGPPEALPPRVAALHQYYLGLARGGDRV